VTGWVAWDGGFFIARVRWEKLVATLGPWHVFTFSRGRFGVLEGGVNQETMGLGLCVGLHFSEIFAPPYPYGLWFVC